MVGLSQRSISDLESGKTMKTDKLRELADVCGVSPEWLLGKEADESNRRELRLVSDWPAHGVKQRPLVDVQPGDGKSHTVLASMLRVPELDVRGGASYSGGIVDEEHVDNGITKPAVVANWGLPTEFVVSELGLQSADMDIIKVRGDSMDDGSAKGLASGDRVMVDRGDRDVRQGGIFVVFDGMGVIIKQVELDREAQPPRIVCKSLNTRYSPIHLVLEEPVHVIGRVAARISRM